MAQRELSAAFRRLCVETDDANAKALSTHQPPLGGCVLKPLGGDTTHGVVVQPPLGGCVLKLNPETAVLCGHNQPPLGGCVLKPAIGKLTAAILTQPPLGGCVLKPDQRNPPKNYPRQPPLGGCVLKPARLPRGERPRSSRL